MKKTKNIAHLTQLLKQLKNIKVENLLHNNQFIITSDNFNVFQSYDSIIAVHSKNDDVLVLGCRWDYSATTLRHLYIFLDKYTNISIYGSNKKKAIKKLINDGSILYDSNLF